MKNYFQAPWTFKQVVKTLLLASILLFIAIIAIFSLAYLLEFKTSESLNFISLVVGFLIQWGGISIAFLSFAPKGAFKMKAWGLKKMKPLKLIKSVIGNYGLYLIIALIVSMFIIYTGIKIPGYQVQENLLEYFGTDTLNIVVAGVIIVLIAPVIEEFFFRGFILRAITDKYGIYWGSTITAFIFAISHMQIQSVIPLFILGLIINGMVIRHKNILPAIAFHILNNTIAFAIQLLIVTGKIPLEEIL